MFKSGSTKTTQIGYINRNQQKNLGIRETEDTDHGQVTYKLQCQKGGYHFEYGANGTDIFQPKFLKCQGGLKGIEF